MCQSQTALGAAVSNHRPATAGFHAGPEAVGTGTLEAAWLVSTFHGFFSGLGASELLLVRGVVGRPPSGPGRIRSAEDLCQ